MGRVIAADLIPVTVYMRAGCSQYKLRFEEEGSVVAVCVEYDDRARGWGAQDRGDTCAGISVARETRQKKPRV